MSPTATGGLQRQVTGVEVEVRRLGRRPGPEGLRPNPARPRPPDLRAMPNLRTLRDARRVPETGPGSRRDCE